MERLRVSVVIESDADAELYNYLVNIPSRRRATLIRTFATQGMNSEGQLKAVFGQVEHRPTANSTVQESKKVRPIPESKDHPGAAGENEKEKALNRAIGNLDFQ